MTASADNISEFISVCGIVGVMWGLYFCFTSCIPNRELIRLQEENAELRSMLCEQSTIHFASSFADRKNR